MSSVKQVAARPVSPAELADRGQYALLFRRACRAYAGWCRRKRLRTPRPRQDLSQVTTSTVVLVSSTGPVAEYSWDGLKLRRIFFPLYEDFVAVIAGTWFENDDSRAAVKFDHLERLVRQAGDQELVRLVQEAREDRVVLPLLRRFAGYLSVHGSTEEFGRASDGYHDLIEKWDARRKGVTSRRG